MSNQGGSRWEFTLALISVIAVIATGVAIMMGWTKVPAHSEQPVKPTDCVHADVHSHRADACRAAGWTIRNALVVDPHAVVRYSALPHCKSDEATGGPCTWNIGDRVDGNGVGLSFWVGPNDHLHYVTDATRGGRS